MVAHILGILGEGLNLIGAIILALEIFQRQDERKRERDLEKLNTFAKNAGLKGVYLGIPVNDPDFARRVIDRRAARLAFRGVVLLAAGFLLLLSYHIAEM